jgi:hypothetical protein
MPENSQKTSNNEKSNKETVIPSRLMPQFKLWLAQGGKAAERYSYAQTFMTKHRNKKKKEWLKSLKKK